MAEKFESNRRRKWAPKARSGCRTCKIRHVKCDETKPACGRCVQSGFRCDGYPALPAKREVANSPASDEADVSPRSVSPGAESSPSFLPEKSEAPASSMSGLLALVPHNPSAYRPAEPYVDGERKSLQFFINFTAVMVSRSNVGPQFWQKLVPQAAWSYPSVRHALLASSIASESLFRRKATFNLGKQPEMQVLAHTSKAVQCLLSSNPPIDVTLLTSALLGTLELFNGRWDAACTHVTSGAKLAMQAQADPNSDPFIKFYCEAFASALPEILTRASNSGSRLPTKKNSVVRLREAVESLELAISTFDETIPKVRQHVGIDKHRILHILRVAKTESAWILSRWLALLELELKRSLAPDEELQTSVHRIESPWSAIIKELNVYLDHGGVFDVDKFEIAMERTLPFFMLAKSGPNLRMREDAAQLMFLGSQLRGRLISPQKQRIIMIDDHG